MKIRLVNGPNLALLGKREPGIYGQESLDDIVAAVRRRGEALGVTVEAFQNDVEGELVLKYFESPPLVAVTTHVPAVLATNRPATTAQPVAVPLVTEYDTPPLPEPPVVDKSSGVPTTPAPVTR